MQQDYVPEVKRIVSDQLMHIDQHIAKSVNKSLDVRLGTMTQHALQRFDFIFGSDQRRDDGSSRYRMTEIIRWFYGHHSLTKYRRQISVFDYQILAVASDHVFKQLLSLSASGASVGKMTAEVVKVFAPRVALRLEELSDD